MAARSTDPFALPPIDEKTGGRVQVSFSGGRTSAYMLHRLIAANDGLPEDRVEVVFANTGREREATLAFVAEVAHRWGLMITWVEWRPQTPGFEVVGYQGAARAGEPFEALIRKKRYLPNQHARFCTSELKVRAARDYLRSVGWTYWTTAIGIRADELHRTGKADLRERWSRWTPLVDAEVTRRDVARFWQAQPFDLKLGHVDGRCSEGNCDGCFLKSDATLAALHRDRPSRSAWWEEMEEVASGLTSNPNGARFSKRYSRASLNRFVEKQRNWIFDAKGSLCQAAGGECAPY